MKHQYKIISFVFFGLFIYTNYALGEEQTVFSNHQSNYRLNSNNNSNISSNSQTKTSTKNYTAIIMADPQAWRLLTGNPNSESNRVLWIQKNREVAKAIKSHKAAFLIVNGDLTEFGRQKTYDDYANVYKNLGAPVYEGLGNHDYANNVGACTIPQALNFFPDACAISAVERMLQEMKKYSKTLAHFNQDVTDRWVYLFNSSLRLIRGSLSYSWDYGDIHYVQLHNYPTYTVNLSQRSTSVHIEKALDWLERDLTAADARGKVTIINFHDARPYYDNIDSHFLHPKNAKDLAVFKSIITRHNVKAIFAGHEHIQGCCRAPDDKVFGNIPVYTAGALFKGDYYLIEVQGKDVYVKAYNGKTGKPALVRNFGRMENVRTFDWTCSFFQFDL
ncbi:cytolysin (calcineurin-like family phosphatase) [Bartonella callosciuri]|uniref:Cytolysin (Calcineurin-like family phosphatase) n=1 Tax=Bartonella callosciuri TaxID=686223 RepID=A0A840NYC1_9HYPH|nr:metallophosphoesterase [Bartonella callosciuri]MBB5074352.1 cytolysin (calcineurin-like family phosphatase) [Bartonella callosciuri]